MMSIFCATLSAIGCTMNIHSWVYIYTHVHTREREVEGGRERDRERDHVTHSCKRRIRRVSGGRRCFVRERVREKDSERKGEREREIGREREGQRASYLCKRGRLRASGGKTHNLPPLSYSYSSPCSFFLINFPITHSCKRGTRPVFGGRIHQVPPLSYSCSFPFCFLDLFSNNSFVQERDAACFWGQKRCIVWHDGFC